MNDLSFYPTLTKEMLEASGFSFNDKYTFKYSYQNRIYELNQKGNSIIKLDDPLDIWRIETEGIIINRIIKFAYPDFLKGTDGVACKNADLGICIMWTNKKLTQTGIILPETDVISAQGRTCVFNYSFESGRLSGDLELTLMMYIKKKAETVSDDEEHLINETGVTVGEIDKTIVDFNSPYMEFPIEEYRSEKEPLWWVEFYEWEDPRNVDLFSRDSFCLYLNPYYESCPAPSLNGDANQIKNVDLLVDILAQVYFLIFKRLSDDELKATKQDIRLPSNTICSVMHEFIEDCKSCHELQWESDEALLKSIQINIRHRLQEDV